ncbi:MAG: DUF4129 domain-containing transglutaminase family protein [Cellulosilyticaceae bacterium]
MKSKWSLNLFQVLVVLLSCITASWCLGTLIEISSMFFFIPVGLLQYISLIFFNEIKDKGNKSILYYLLYGLAIYLPVFILQNLKAMDTFKEFVAIILLGSIFISLIYYFTVVRFRAMTLVLVLCLPGALCIRQGQSIVGIECISYLIVFLGLYQVNVGCNSLSEDIELMTREKATVYSLICISVVTLGIYLVVPKPELYITNPLSKILQQYMKENPKYDPSTLPRTASVTETPGELGERVLFHVKGDAPTYLKTRGWNAYKDNSWYIEGTSFDLGHGLPLDMTDQDMYDKVYVMLESLALLNEEGMLEDMPELQALMTYKKSEKHTGEIEIIPQDYSIRMYLAPMGLIEVVDEEDAYLTSSGTCFNSDRSKPGSNPYILSYIQHTLGTDTREVQFLKQMTPEKYKALVDVVEERLVEIWEFRYRRALTWSIMEQEGVYENYLDLPNTISDRTYELARALTEGYDSTYEKVRAIEAYFHTGEFYYDLKAEPTPEGEEAVDYFLFESQRGACVQFASAMTILCRAAGIPANLMEGYVCDTYDEKLGAYVIQEKHAHAFPEVYVPGYGWMLFEPTTANEATGSMGREPLQPMAKLFIAGISLSIVIGMVGLLMIWGMYERLWQVTIQYQKPNQQVIGFYRRLFKRLQRKGYPITSSTTPLQVQAVLQEKEIAVSILVEQYQKVYYGGRNLSQEEVRQAFVCYKEAYKSIKSY